MKNDPDVRNAGPPLRASAFSRVSAAIHFSLFATLSITAGFAPLILFLGRPYWLIWVSSISLAISLVYGFRLDPLNQRPLTAKEALVVIFSSVSNPSIMSTLLFLLYGVVWFIGWIVSLIGWSRAWAPVLGDALVAFLGLFLSLGVAGLTAGKLQGLLFPPVGIGNAPLVVDDSGQISPRAFFATAFLVVLVSLSIFVSSYFLILLQLVLAVTSLPASVRLHRRKMSPRNLTLRTAVKNMLRVLDYVVVDRLQTGQLKQDRLISVFDIVAHSEGYALAIQLKTEEEGSTLVSWSDAGYLKSASRPVYFALRNIHASVHSVLPILVLCGRESDDTLTEFAQEESIIVAKTDWPTIENIAGDKLSHEQIREIAQSQFKIRPAHIVAEVAV